MRNKKIAKTIRESLSFDLLSRNRIFPLGNPNYHIGTVREGKVILRYQNVGNTDSLRASFDLLKYLTSKGIPYREVLVDDESLKIFSKDGTIESALSEFRDCLNFDATVIGDQYSKPLAKRLEDIPVVSA